MKEIKARNLQAQSPTPQPQVDAVKLPCLLNLAACKCQQAGDQSVSRVLL